MKLLGNSLATPLAFLALSTPAWAADPITFEPPPVPPAEVASHDWTGPYVGVQGGFGWANLEQTAGPDFFLEGNSVDLSGPFIGAHAGYNAQWDNLILGVEGDINASWIDGDFIWGGDETGSARVNWFGSLRGRLGLAVDKTLFFGTAGLAVAGVNIDLPAISVSDDQTYMGWTAGLGIEHMLKENWSVRGEYRYYDFQNATFFESPIERDFDLTMHTVSVGLTYKF